MRRLLPFILALVFAAPAAAAPPVSTGCTAHVVTTYKRVVLRVKRHGHWHVVYHRVRRHGHWVRVPRYHRVAVHHHGFVCAPGRSHATRLKAHLDPSFVQDPANPLRVTYTYGATAAAQTFSAADVLEGEEPAGLPEGVLNFYTDGLLKCSTEVSGSDGFRECPVAYASPGAHTVTVTFTSGTTVATETEEDVIPAYSTTTAVSTSTVPHGSGQWLLNLDATVLSQTGQPVPGPVEWCLPVEGGSECQSAPAHLTFLVTESQSVAGVSIERYELGPAFSGPGGVFPTVCQHTEGFCRPTRGDYWRAQFEAGAFSASASYPGTTGFLRSASAVTAVPFAP